MLLASDGVIPGACGCAIVEGAGYAPGIGELGCANGEDGLIVTPGTAPGR